ncbi:hypothetical protein ACIP4Y_21760 [Streptomyces sp. NPDC088810]|uniref:hypothetical protein n=1 Tax=Streptomyces sp. NPDC088810 TaxID=3365904 RepID=UPI003801F4F2
MNVRTWVGGTAAARCHPRGGHIPQQIASAIRGMSGRSLTGTDGARFGPGRLVVSCLT